MTCRRCIEIVALVALVLAARPARAQDDGFKTHYETALSHYSSEDYVGAIHEFQAAYAIRPKPRLLFNIGQSYRSLGNAREALRYYLLYQALESNPKPGLKAELEGYIAQMKSIVAAAERARRAEDHEPPPKDVTGNTDAATANGSNAVGSNANATNTSGSNASAATINAANASDLNTNATNTGGNGATPAQLDLAAHAALTRAAPSKPVYKRGWFWGVIGGAAAVVVVTGLAVGLTVNQGPGYGGDIRHLDF